MFHNLKPSKMYYEGSNLPVSAQEGNQEEVQVGQAAISGVLG